MKTEISPPRRKGKKSKATTLFALGVAGGTLLIHQPDGWKRKLRANIRRAVKLGAKIDPPSFNDLSHFKVEGKSK
jgi:hypothetical protein